VANKVVHSTADQVAERKKAIEARCVRAKVVGVLAIRDAVTREDIVEGGIVRLDPGEPGKPGGTLISALVESGAIELLPEEPAKGKQES
jgi:hypothetical protein